MISQTILTLVLVIGFHLVTIADAENTTVINKNKTNGCLPVATTKLSVVNGSLCEPYGLLFSKGGYCKDIIGYLPVYGRDKNELALNERKLRRYEMTAYLVQNMAKEFLRRMRQNLTDGQKGTKVSSFEVRKSCLERVDDIYCHDYFKRCYISSGPQPVCREACEELLFKFCDREYKMVLDFNRKRLQFPDWPFSWDIINCTTLPFRNESRNCYFPDKIREKLNVLESEDCFYGDGRGYRGNASTTVSGYTCQMWNSQCPHKHNISEGIYEEIRNSSNFCRNPGGLSLNGPWCFTTNRTVRWEHCDVPKCAKQPPARPPADFRGQKTSSTSIRIFWGDVPKPFVNGILLGFHVVCSKLNSSNGFFMALEAKDRNWEFKGLEKFMQYGCWVRAYNNFGNGTWSEELVILTDEDAPSAPPESLNAWNLSSTRLYVQWGQVPARERNGKILGYFVEIKPDQGKQGRRNPTTNFTASRSLTLSGLSKYSKYVISVCALTRRGKGPSRTLTVRTDEDVPDHPPADISAISLGADAVQLDWRPVPAEYTNGELLGYKAIYSDVNDTSSSNTTVASTEQTRLKIGGLRPNTNYSFQILAFTVKGDGAISTNYFAKTLKDHVNGQKLQNTGKLSGSATGTATIVVAAVLTGTLVLGAAFTTIYFIRIKRRISPNSNNEESVHCSVTPYAISSPDWIERIIATDVHEYETPDENFHVTSRQALYINIAADGTLDLPPYLRNMVFEFEQSYENTRYKRLHWRRCSLGGAEDMHGHAIYDNLQRVISPAATRQSKNCDQEAPETITTGHKQHHEIDLGELRGFVRALQDVCNAEMTEINAKGQTSSGRRRRFSVDLGELREFVAFKEKKGAEETTAQADQPEVKEASHNEATC